MNAQERLQINIRVTDLFVLYENVSEAYVPIMWIEQVLLMFELKQMDCC